MVEIIKHLGRKPKREEYKKVWRYLFGDMAGKDRKNLRKQRQRHLSHTNGHPSIARRYCVFCEGKDISSGDKQRKEEL